MDRQFRDDGLMLHGRGRGPDFEPHFNDREIRGRPGMDPSFDSQEPGDFGGRGRGEFRGRGRTDFVGRGRGDGPFRGRGDALFLGRGRGRGDFR